MIEYLGTYLDTLPSDWNVAKSFLINYYDILPSLPVSISILNEIVLYEDRFTIDIIEQFRNGYLNITKFYRYIFPTNKFSVILDDKIYYNWYDIFLDIDWKVRKTLDLIIIFSNVDIVFDTAFGYDFFSSSLFYNDNIFDLLKSYYKTKCPEELINVAIIEKNYIKYHYPLKLVPSEWQYDKFTNTYKFPELI
jgi:hypothetical protein